MSYTHKVFSSNDKSITPFIVHKTISAISGSNSDIKLYKGKYEKQTFDIGSLDSDVLSLPKTQDDKYQYLVFDSLQHLYYSQYVNNSFINITNNFDKKNIYEYVSCFSVPRTYFGEKITKNETTVTLNVSGSIKNLVDDGDYNLIDPSVSASLYQQITSGSIAKWDFSDGYIFENGYVSDYYIRDRSPNGNHALLKNVRFVDCAFGKEVEFNTTSSFIQVKHQTSFNFFIDDNFNISFLARIPVISSYPPSGEEIIIAKHSLGDYSSYPFEISILKGDDNGKIKFSRGDGRTRSEVTSSLAYNDNAEHFFVCQKEGSNLQLYVDGILSNQVTDNSISQTDNTSDLYIGIKGNTSQSFNGFVKSIEIKETALNRDLILYQSQQTLSQSFDYYVGNIFYEQGLIAITSNSQYFRNFNTYVDSGSVTFPVSWSLSGTGTNTIFEHEYICTCHPGELNYSLNKSLITRGRQSYANYLPFVASGSFSPYITSIGLYNENYELLLIAKLSRPIPRLKKMDQTFIVRFDV